MVKIVFFTNSYPFGIGERWKTQELEIIQQWANEILVIPLSYGGNKQMSPDIPKTIRVAKPLFEIEPEGVELGACLRVLFQHFKLFLKEFFGNRLWASKSRLVKSLSFMSNAGRLLSNDYFRDIIESDSPNTIFYFYWGRGSADAIPFLLNRTNKILVRLHGYDLYEQRNNGYIPFRKKFYERINSIVTISQAGFKEIADRFPNVQYKISVFRLGTISLGRSQSSTDGIFRIVSCSSMVPVKRVTLIALAIRRIEGMQLKWTHIGSGPEMPMIKDMCTRLPDNIKVELIGKINPADVIPIYCRDPFDLFVNVSESEGVPVSIMESLSAGIPVLATDAGGTREIVDEKVGKLLNVNLTEKELADAILAFSQIEQAEKIKLRDSAFIRYKECCDMKASSNMFVEHLKSII